MFDWLVLHAMRALYPRTDSLPGMDDTDPEAFLARFRAEASLALRLGVVLGAAVFAATPIVTVYWPLPSFLLPRATLDRHADRITSTPIYLLRQAVFLVKLAAGLCWGQHPSTRRAMAMPPYPEDPGTWKGA